MTNTGTPAHTIPAHTLTGPVCSKCSHWDNGSRVQLRHIDIKAVRTCNLAPTAPVVALPAFVAPAANTAPAPALPKAAPKAPVTKKFNRWSASCPRKGCKTHAIKDAYFVLKCSNHGAKPVRVRAAQLVGTMSTAAKHKCNSSCLAAVGATCTCACGGANHGIGLMVTMTG
ncbi:MAG: hypothetical protein WC054_00015 [Candidatus Nanopelagicales bacterium]